VTVMNRVEAIKGSDQRRLHFSQAVLKGFLVLLFSILLFSPAVAQNAKQKSPGPKVNQASKPAEPRYSDVSFKYSNRRDPFLNPLLLKKNAKTDVDEEESRGTPPPGIGGTFIAQAALQGVSIRDSGRMAVVRGSDGRTYFLKEGDRLFDGYLKTIEADSIRLVRETKMKSGKTLTQDVIKRLIRTP
jgi:hypothetical protein